MDFLKHFERNPGIVGGEAVIRGTRVPLRTILASLADGDSIESVREQFPTVTEADVRAVIAFAAASAHDDLPTPSVPKVA